MKLIDDVQTFASTTEDKPDLAELLTQITDENRHSEVDVGIPVGQEIW